MSKPAPMFEVVAGADILIHSSLFSIGASIVFPY